MMQAGDAADIDLRILAAEVRSTRAEVTEGRQEIAALGERLTVHERHLAAHIEMDERHQNLVAEHFRAVWNAVPALVKQDVSMNKRLDKVEKNLGTLYIVGQVLTLIVAKLFLT